MTDSTDDVDWGWGPDEAPGDVVLSVEEAKVCLGALRKDAPTSASLRHKAIIFLQRAIEEVK